MRKPQNVEAAVARKASIGYILRALHRRYSYSEPAVFRQKAAGLLFVGRIIAGLGKPLELGHGDAHAAPETRDAQAPRDDHLVHRHPTEAEQPACLGYCHDERRALRICRDLGEHLEVLVVIPRLLKVHVSNQIQDSIVRNSTGSF